MLDGEPTMIAARILPADRRSTRLFDRAVQKTLIRSRRIAAATGEAPLSRAQVVARVLGRYQTPAHRPTVVDRVSRFLDATAAWIKARSLTAPSRVTVTAARASWWDKVLAGLPIKARCAHAL